MLMKARLMAGISFSMVGGLLLVVLSEEVTVRDGGNVGV
jgi:hypothetical protein